MVHQNSFIWNAHCVVLQKKKKKRAFADQAGPTQRKDAAFILSTLFHANSEEVLYQNKGLA